MIIIAENERKHMIYKKFYMSDEELFNLNRKVAQTHFTRSSYLRLMVRGYQPKEDMPPDLKEFYFQLHRLYSPLSLCLNILLNRYPSVCEKTNKTYKNLGKLNCEIMETLSLYEEKRYRKKDDVNA